MGREFEYGQREVFIEILQYLQPTATRADKRKILLIANMAPELTQIVLLP
jgi:hypothetical protein